MKVRGSLPLGGELRATHQPVHSTSADRQETLTKHKPMVAQYLEQNYDRVSSLADVTDPSFSACTMS